jgi:hypothetical protein
MQSKTFKATIVRDGSACFIPLTFDPTAVFGTLRAPVTRARRIEGAVQMVRSGK